MSEFQNMNSLKSDIAKLIFDYLVENKFVFTAQTFIDEYKKNNKKEQINFFNSNFKNNADDLSSIVEDYFESKKYALIQCCNDYNSKFLKLRDVLSNLYNIAPKEDIIKKEVIINKRRRKRKVDSVNGNYETSQSQEIRGPIQNNFGYITVQNMTPLAEFMAYNINRAANGLEEDNAQQLIPSQNTCNVDVDAVNYFDNIKEDDKDYKGIFLESLDNVYRNQRSPSPRTDILITPEKEITQSTMEFVKFQGKLSNTKLNESHSKYESLDNIWDKIWRDKENEAPVNGVPTNPVSSQSSSLYSNIDHSVEQKTQILRNTDLAQFLKDIKNTKDN